MYKRPLAAGFAAALALIGVTTEASAQQYPSKAIRWIVPYPPGASPDLLTRVLAEQLSKKIGQPVLVENQPGAGGMIGAKFVSQAAPDGHTLLTHTPAWPATVVFVKDSPIPVPEGLEPVSLLVEGHFAFTASPKLPANTFKEFVAYAQANPGKIATASTGPGDALLNLETIKAFYKLDTVNVLYRGSVQSLQALMTDEVQIAMQPEFAAAEQAKTGKVKVLAVTGNGRTSVSPDVPTFTELGHPNVRNPWFAVFAPAKTPPALLDRISADIVSVLKMPEISKRLAEITVDPVGSTPDELRRHIATTIEEYKTIAKAVGIQPE